MHSPYSSGVFGEEVEEVGKSEHEEMLECAGIVLLQSYRTTGSGRVCEFFDILEKLNVGITEWPLILLETGACLQISDGAFPVARAALEDLLAVQSTFSSKEKYAQVVELLVIKVILKKIQKMQMERMNRSSSFAFRHSSRESTNQDSISVDATWQTYLEFVGFEGGHTVSLQFVKITVLDPFHLIEIQAPTLLFHSVPHR